MGKGGIARVKLADITLASMSSSADRRTKDSKRHKSALRASARTFMDERERQIVAKGEPAPRESKMQAAAVFLPPAIGRRRPRSGSCHTKRRSRRHSCQSDPSLRIITLPESKTLLSRSSVRIHALVRSISRLS